MLQIGKKEYEKIIGHAVKGLPNEACGLIGGEVIEDINVVKEVYLLCNLDESNEHFSMDPVEQLAAVKDIRSKGYLLFGNFHSHPQTPARPSEEDKRLAFDSKASYLIVSLQDSEKPVLKAFRIIGQEATEEPIILPE
jgi:proteasome lid subunit RPN8/RPN11